MTDQTLSSLPRTDVPIHRRRRGLLLRIWDSRMLYLLLLPTVIGMILFQYYPALQAFWGSFNSWDGRHAHYIGVYNYQHFLDDPRLLLSFGNVALFLIFNVVSLSVPLLVAYLIYRIPSSFQRYLYRVLIVIPVVVPGFVFIVLWRWLFSLNGGINVILRTVGIDSNVIWLGNAQTALGSLMFMGFPWIDAFTVLIFLAGFLTVPHEILDAAAVDGARGWDRFWHIELPSISGQIKVMVILGFIGTIQDFGRPLFMTQGGPGWTTMVPGLRMYYAFTQDNAYGYASAIGVILFIIIFVLTLLNQRLIRGSED
ncbi:MAG TPA: sugar ABC transporter permease [Phototrophicaceae bacterium]|nr:sugar ABC transporter permease [Phototrophicaceae bacterium]